MKKLFKRPDNAMNYSKLSAEINRLSLNYLAYALSVLADRNQTTVRNFDLYQFTNQGELGYIIDVVAKSTTERQNSNRHTANSSTPFNRAFFVRSLRTPKENNKLLFLDGVHKMYPIIKDDQFIRFLSMVACNGKGLGKVSPFAVFRVLQFLTPLHVTAQ